MGCSQRQASERNEGALARGLHDRRLARRAAGGLWRLGRHDSRVGFEDRQRVHYCVFHFDIKNEKIWIQHDATDIPVAQLVLDAGVPKEDLVLAFHPPYRRALSGFAIA